MVYAYIRVSTEMQTCEGQRLEINNYCRSHNIIVGKWFSESVSGTISVEKRVLGRLIKKLKGTSSPKEPGKR